MSKVKKGVGCFILLAPFIFICHFSEEASGFVLWFNQHVHNGINYRLFWDVNITALVITVVVSLMESISPSAISDSMVILWFCFLMLAKAILHIAGSLEDGAYMPGLVTAIILYIPFYFLIIPLIINKHRIRIPLAITIACLGALPMLIHGYMILFLGDRLF
jgi:Protein of unknown function with HXXEE motif